MHSRGKFGNLAEETAAVFLEKKGYKILARQFRVRSGEIDLIVKDGEEIVFVEVKARRNTKFGHPTEAVDWRKIKKMVLAANIYIDQNKLRDVFYRFDIIAMLQAPDGQFEIEHLEAIDTGSDEC
jgi:putative endonuclease